MSSIEIVNCAEGPAGTRACITCPRCFDMHERPTASCPRCGCALPLECAACGAVNAATATACYKCTAPLIDLRALAEPAEEALPPLPVVRYETPTKRPVRGPALVVESAPERSRRTSRATRTKGMVALLLAIAATAALVAIGSGRAHTAGSVPATPAKPLMTPSPVAAPVTPNDSSPLTEPHATAPAAVTAGTMAPMQSGPRSASGRIGNGAKGTDGGSKEKPRSPRQRSDNTAAGSDLHRHTASVRVPATPTPRTAAPNRTDHTVTLSTRTRQFMCTLYAVLRKECAPEMRDSGS